MNGRVLGIPLAGLLIGILASQVLGQDAQTLTYAYKQGNILRYRIDMSLIVSSRSRVPGTAQIAKIPPTQLKVAGIWNEQVKRVTAGGDAEVLYTFEQMKLSSNGIDWQDTPLSELPPMTMLMSPNGTVKSIESVATTGGGLAAIPFLNLETVNQYVGALPPGSPKVGDTWNQDVPIPVRGSDRSIGNLNIKGRMLSLNEQRNGYPVVKFLLNLEGKSRFLEPVPPGSVSTQPGQYMDTAGTVTAQVTNYFSPTLGRMIYAEGSGLVLLSVEIKNPAKNNQEDLYAVAAVNTGITVNYQITLLGDTRH